MAEDPGLEGQRPLPAGTLTLGRVLQQAGYRTGFVGKWGLGGPLTEGIPNEQGFDFFFGYNCQRQAHTYYPLHLTLDEQVGAIVARLEELGLRGSTVILFSSDNGPISGLAGTDAGYFDSARPFRSEAGRGSAEIPGALDGLSFVPELLGRSGEQRRHEFLYWEFPSYGGQQAVRLERFKGIRRDMLEGETALQLFDLESDPREEHDVADAHPGVVAEIQAILEREHTPSPIERFRFPVLGEE